MILADVEGTLQAVVDVLNDTSTFRASSQGIRVMLSHLRATLLLEEPLRFLSYWGIGNKVAPGMPEERALNFQIEALERLAAIMNLPWSLEYIVTDTHAVINGRSPDIIDRYSRSVARMLTTRGCECNLMTKFLHEQGVSFDLESLRRAAEGHWSKLRPERKSELIKLASRHCGELDKEAGAACYYMSNLVEGALISRARAASIFITYMLPSMAFMLPTLPTFYIYVQYGRDVRRPWFLEQE